MDHREFFAAAACWKVQEDSTEPDESSAVDPSSEESACLEPMDAGTYKIILKAQGRYFSRLGRAHSQLDGPDMREYRVEEIALIEDFVSNKAVWTGNYWRDMWLFLININPVIALCYSHPLHPILRRERIFFYALSIVFVTWVTINLTKTDKCHSCGLDACRKDMLPQDPVGAITWRPLQYLDQIEDANVSSWLKNLTCHPPPGADKKEWEQRAIWLPGFCCDAFFWGAMAFIRTFGRSLGSCLYALITNCVFAVVCFQLLMCPCVQQRTWRCRRAGELTGSMCFISLAVFLLWRSQDMMRYTWDNGDVSRALWNWLQVKVIGSVGITIWNVIVFSFVFQMQRPKEGDGVFARLAPDPPERGEADTRGCLAKLLSPRFCILASEYHRFPGALGPGV